MKEAGQKNDHLQHCQPLPGVTFENIFDLEQLISAPYQLTDGPVLAVRDRPETGMDSGLYLFKGPGFDPYRFALDPPAKDVYYCREGDPNVDQQRLAALNGDLVILAQLKAWGLRDLPVRTINRDTHTALFRQVAEALIEQGKIQDQAGKLVSPEQSSEELVTILTEWFRLKFQAAAAGEEVKEIPTINSIIEEVYIATFKLRPNILKRNECILNEAGRARYIVESSDEESFVVRVGTQLEDESGVKIGPNIKERITFTRVGDSDSMVFVYHDEESGKQFIINTSESIKVVRIVDGLA